MAQRFGKSLALDYLAIEDPMLALLIDDAAHQRLLAIEKRGKPRTLGADERYSTDADYDDSDWTPP
jgi:hypothetical protein